MTTSSQADTSAPSRPRPRPAAALTRPMRPRELEDGLNYYLYHPLAWRLARVLAKTPISPNAVSVVGACHVVAAGVAYAALPWPVGPAVGMSLHMAWHVWDGADGDLARITGKASPIGEMVDGICDYASHVVLYLILGWLLHFQIGGWAYALMWGAGFSHIIQANHVEVQKRSYQWWVYNKPWMRQTRSNADNAATRRGISGALVGLYMYVAGKFAGNTPLIDAAVAAAQNDPARLAAIQTAARAEAPRLLGILKILGPNPRAIVLGLSMFAGSAAWYFLWLIVGLNLLLVVSIAMHNAAARRILAVA